MSYPMFSRSLSMSGTKGLPERQFVVNPASKEEEVVSVFHWPKPYTTAKGNYSIPLCANALTQQGVFLTQDRGKVNCPNCLKLLDEGRG